MVERGIPKLQGNQREDSSLTVGIDKEKLLTATYETRVTDQRAVIVPGYQIYSTTKRLHGAICFIKYEYMQLKLRLASARSGPNDFSSVKPYLLRSTNCQHSFRFVKSEQKVLTNFVAMQYSMPPSFNCAIDTGQSV